MKKNPLVSILIVNYNGKKWLQESLESIKKQTYRNYETILVDNNSTDGSTKFVQKKFPKAKIVRSNENLGFAGGNNLGFSKAKGDLILFLNNDTKFDKYFLEKLVCSFENQDIDIAQPMIVLRDKKRIDSCGSFWTDTSFLYYVGNDKSMDLPIYKRDFPVFSVKGAAFIVKRVVIEDIGLFDDSFWNYYEETDFCHRAWIAGYQCWYCPKAVCFHAMGGTSLTFDNSYIQFHNFKNKLNSIMKNFERRNLPQILFKYFVINLSLSFVWLFQGKPKHFFALYKSMVWNISNIRQTLKLRNKVQKLRIVSDKEIFKIVKKNPNVAYYRALFGADFSKYPDSNEL